jgi:hypothetical protein
MSNSTQGQPEPGSLPAVVEVAGRRAHPDAGQIARFMLGVSPRAEARSVVRHLLTDCPQCLQVTRPLWRCGDKARPKIPGAGVPAKAECVPVNPETQV